MNNKLKILGLAIVALFAIWLVYVVVGVTLQIVMTKLFLVALITGSFIVFRRTKNEIAKYILIASMLLGIFVFDMIINILFMLIVLIIFQIVRRVDVKTLGPIQIILIIFAIIYMYLFGIFATLAKLIAVLAVIALFLAIIWSEIKIYFSPTPKANSDEVDFVDQNVEHQANRIYKHLSKFINLELMTKDIALNLGFGLYMLLVIIQMLSEVVYFIIPFTS